MLFFDIIPEGFPAGAQFFFNLAIATIAIPLKSTLLPLGIDDYWYLGAVTESRPFAIHIYRDERVTSNDVETFPHCVLELDPTADICWYDLVDYETVSRSLNIHSVSASASSRYPVCLSKQP